MSSTAEPHTPISRGSTVIAAFSTIVEWYDFTLYLYFATVLSRVFFGGGEQSLATTLAGFAIAYLMRPLGAVAFGHIGDRHGRRPTLLLSVAIMTAAMLGIALLPSYADIGAAAGGLLIAFRCVMGFAVGAEYTGVVAYLVEGAPRARRGFITSLAAAASEVGALLAVAVSALTVSALSPGDLDAWGWRIPFFVGAALATTVWIARSMMQESPDFERQRSAGTVPSSPLHYTLTRQPGGIARAFTISALGSITYYVGITYVPAFLTSAGGLGEAEALRLSTLAAVAVILVTPVTGALADRLGRKPVLLVLAGCSAVLPASMFLMMASGSQEQAVVGAIVLAAVAGGVSAVGAVATAEQFTGEGRLSGLAFGATGATVIFGGLTPWFAQLLVDRTGSAMMPGAMIAAVAIFVLPVLLGMRETCPRQTAASPLAQEDNPAMKLNLSVDEVLTTTRAVRKRLDVTKPVPRALLEECLELALQAPNGSNRNDWRWIIVDDPAMVAKLAQEYRLAMGILQSGQMPSPAYLSGNTPREDKLLESAYALAEKLDRMPAILIPLMPGRPDGKGVVDQAALWGSIVQAVWSFFLALRDRGLGSVWTTVGSRREKEIAELLGIPVEQYTQVGLFPIAYTIGTDFKRAWRKPVSEVLSYNGF